MCEGSGVKRAVKVGKARIKGKNAWSRTVDTTQSSNESTSVSNIVARRGRGLLAADAPSTCEVSTTTSAEKKASDKRQYTRAGIGGRPRRLPHQEEERAAQVACSTASEEVTAKRSVHDARLTEAHAPDAKESVADAQRRDAIGLFPGDRCSAKTTRRRDRAAAAAAFPRSLATRTAEFVLFCCASKNVLALGAHSGAGPRDHRQAVVPGGGGGQPLDCYRAIRAIRARKRFIVWPRCNQTLGAPVCSFAVAVIELVMTASGAHYCSVPSGGEKSRLSGKWFTLD
ncbi:hypothetical protein MRX96_013331 [Rhipicephalus microplus]